MKNKHRVIVLIVCVSLFILMNSFLIKDTKNFKLKSGSNFTEKANKFSFPKGIYVASGWNKPIPETVLTCENVDGVFLRLYWDRLQPEKDKFNWTSLDEELKRISATGKKISLGVAAGAHSPLWIYDAGVPDLEFTEFRHQGKGKIFNVKVPVPWDSNYLELWTNFISEFSEHLKLDTTVYKSVSLIKLSGINESTIEIRLPAQKGISNERGSGTDALAIWRKAGYKPQLVLNAWSKILECWQNNFKDKYVSMAVIPKKAFPALDNSGNEINSYNSDNFTKQLISVGVEKFKDHFAIQWNALRNDAIIPALMTDGLNGLKGNIAKGYQLAENVFAEPDCLNKNDCDQELFKFVLKKGLEEGNAVFIEIFPKDVQAFSKAIAFGSEQMKQR